MSAVSIMDLLMFEAQRQGRLSFYMVRTIIPEIGSALTGPRCQLAKKAYPSAPRVPFLPEM